MQRERALPIDEAFRHIAGDDRRPLLVLRECDRCKGTDHALLDRSLDNEQTMLLLQWFHCVKLPTAVMDAEHPFHALFKPAKEGERIPHLFFCDPDGGNKAPLPGDQTQNQLWTVMYGFLERCYQGDARKSVRELRALLSQYDKVDAMELEVKARIDKEIDKNGPDSPRLKRYEQDLAKLQQERAMLVQKEKQLRALALKELQAQKPADQKPADQKADGDRPAAPAEPAGAGAGSRGEAAGGR